MKLNKKGGESINDYTPLILAIRVRNVARVEELLNMGADPNLKDERERWSPMKWNTYMYLHGPNRDNPDNQRLTDRITELLVMNGANMMDFDNPNYTYNFSPLIPTQVQQQYGGAQKRKVNTKTRKLRKMIKNKKGGVGIPNTEEERINQALSGNYTQLINAIIQLDIDLLNDLLANGANANETDNVYNWCPLKWVEFVLLYTNNRVDFNTFIQFAEALRNARAEPCFDDDTHSQYNFAPIVNNLDEEEILTEINNTRGGRYKKKIKGGKNVTEQTRINDALEGNYTPLINAIITQDLASVETILENGADPNERDNDIYRWCPLKWATFVYYYGNNHDPDMYREIIRSLNNTNPPGRNCFDDYHIEEDSYNFSPVILDIDEQLERIRRENEEDEEDEEENTPNRMNMAGGIRRRQSRKHKKSHKKGKRGSTKRR
jgi:ankyrin repeat protein